MVLALAAGTAVEAAGVDVDWADAKPARAAQRTRLFVTFMAVGGRKVWTGEGSGGVVQWELEAEEAICRVSRVVGVELALVCSGGVPLVVDILPLWDPPPLSRILSC